MEEFKLLIAGSRGFTDYDLLEKTVDDALMSRGITSDRFNIVIICGKASNGADKLGELYADNRGYIKRFYPADWNNLSVTPCVVKFNKYKKPYNALAGFIRNEEMVKTCHLMILFHDGASHGTFDDVKHGYAYNKEFVYINYVDSSKSYTHKCGV